MSNYARAEMPAVYSYTEFLIANFVAGLRPCFFAFLMVPYCDTDRFIV